MSMATAHPEVSSYLSALRAHLEDLPQEERDDLLEDLEQHLAEVAAEADGSLVERLGPPEAYAAELRSSVGLPPDGGRGLGERLLDRARQSAAARVARAVVSTPVYDQVRSFLADLRPGWWVLRGYVAVVGTIWLLAPDYAQDLLLPRLFGGQGFTLAALAAGIWASVALGREASKRMRTRVLSIVVSLIVAGIGVSLISHVQGIAAAAYAETYQDEVVNVDDAHYLPEFLHHADGTPIANICAYRADGKRLKDVLLFDQDGRPITEVAPVTGQAQLPVERTLPKGKDGQSILNAYPHELMVRDPDQLMVRDPDTGELEARPGLGVELRPLPCPSVLVPPQEPADEAPDHPVSPEPVPAD